MKQISNQENTKEIELNENLLNNENLLYLASGQLIGNQYGSNVAEVVHQKYFESLLRSDKITNHIIANALMQNDSVSNEYIRKEAYKILSHSVTTLSCKKVLEDIASKESLKDDYKDKKVSDLDKQEIPKVVTMYLGNQAYNKIVLPIMQKESPYKKMLESILTNARVVKADSENQEYMKDNVADGYELEEVA